MADISTLQELYVDELKDLWSANDQMAKALKKVRSRAGRATAAEPNADRRKRTCACSSKAISLRICC